MLDYDPTGVSLPGDEAFFDKDQTRVINLWIGVPLALRFLVLALLGAMAGALANHVIYTYAYFQPRPISPWSKPGSEAPPRRLGDRIPILGWLGLRREACVHGTGFWIRPVLIELAMAASFVLLYRFEALDGGLLPAIARVPAFLPTFESVGVWIFVAHAVLLTLMVAATFIDFDEKTIPDIITMPGTLVGLVLGSVTINLFMPTSLPVGQIAQSVTPTTFDSPWFARPNGYLGISGLRVGLLIWTVWCFAIADRRWSGVVLRRRGLGRAISHFCAGLVKYGFWKVLMAIWIAGIIGISVVWNLGGNHWLGLFTSLVGLAVGGGIIWAIRIVGTWGLHVEAMGFGDVTLMAMVGAFIGWQAVVVSLVFAMISACVISIIMFIVTRDNQLPFGPYLCLGALLAILFWDSTYNQYFAFELMVMGDVLLWMSIVFLGLLGVTLFAWRQVKIRLIYRD